MGFLPHGDNSTHLGGNFVTLLLVFCSRRHTLLVAPIRFSSFRSPTVAWGIGSENLFVLFWRIRTQSSLSYITDRVESFSFKFDPQKNTEKTRKGTMVVLMVASTTDPASINPANALLAKPGWQPGPHVQDGMKSYVNQGVRVLVHGNRLLKEDDLDKKWEDKTGEVVDEVIFFCQHVAESKKPALTVHAIGTPDLREGDDTPLGGKAGWAAPPNPRMGPWLRHLKKLAEAHNLIPEFEITFEATHHGPVTNKPTMFIEIGSTEDYWQRQDAAEVMAQLVWEGLGLGGGADIGNWSRENAQKRVLFGVGGGHYVLRHMDIAWKDDVWVGHLLPGYAMPMVEPDPKAGKDVKEIGGTWKTSITAAYEATKAAFPGGEIVAHLDQKSFKGWQKNAITAHLKEMNVKIGKSSDF